MSNVERVLEKINTLRIGNRGKDRQRLDILMALEYTVLAVISRDTVDVDQVLDNILDLLGENNDK